MNGVIRPEILSEMYYRLDLGACNVSGEIC